MYVLYDKIGLREKDREEHYQQDASLALLGRHPSGENLQRRRTMRIIDKKLEDIRRPVKADRYIYYRRIRREKLWCDNCGRRSVGYEILRWVSYGVVSIAGVNALTHYYCSKKCLIERETSILRDDCAVAFIQVKDSGIYPIVQKGLPA